MNLQPKLQRVSVPTVDELRGRIAITMRRGQWDTVLSEAYNNLGATLLEIDDNEGVAAAYRKPQENIHS
jgi:hypothetical protein